MPQEKIAFKAKLKQIEDALNAIPGTGVHDIRKFVDGQVSVNEKGELRLQLALPADVLLPNPDDVGQVVRGEWKVVPLLLFVAADNE